MFVLQSASGMMPFASPPQTSSSEQQKALEQASQSLLSALRAPIITSIQDSVRNPSISSPLGTHVISLPASTVEGALKPMLDTGMSMPNAIRSVTASLQSDPALKADLSALGVIDNQSRVLPVSINIAGPTSDGMYKISVFVPAPIEEPSARVIESVPADAHPIKISLSDFDGLSLAPEVKTELGKLIQTIQKEEPQFQQYSQRWLERYLKKINPGPPQAQASALSEMMHIKEQSQSLALETVMALYPAISLISPDFGSLPVEQKAEQMKQMNAVLDADYGIRGARWFSVPPEYLNSTFANHNIPDKKGIDLVVISPAQADIQNTDMIGAGLFGVLRQAVTAENVIVCVANTAEEVAPRMMGRGTLKSPASAPNGDDYHDVFMIVHARPEGMQFGEAPEGYSHDKLLDYYGKIDQTSFDTGDYGKTPLLHSKALEPRFSPDAKIHLIACSAGGVADTSIPQIERFGNVARMVASLTNRPVEASSINIGMDFSVTKKDDGHYTMDYKEKGVSYVKTFEPPGVEVFPMQNKNLMPDVKEARPFSMEYENKKISSHAQALAETKSNGLFLSEHEIPAAYCSDRFDRIELFDGTGNSIALKQTKRNDNALILPLDLPDGPYHIVFSRGKPGSKAPAQTDFSVVDGKIYIKSKSIESKPLERTRWDTH